MENAMRRTRLLLLFLALGACRREAAPVAASPPAVAAAPVNPDPGVRTYRCEDGRTVEAGYPDRDTAIVDVGGHAYTLKSERAASGVRYTGFGLQWWTKGPDEARLAPLKGGETIASDPGVLCRVGAAPAVEPPPPGAPGGLPDDGTPVSEAPFTPASAQGAAQVVQTYYAFLESGRHAEAWRLWSEGAADRAPDAGAFARQFDRYAEYHAQIGAPGEIEGAAGSLYVEVPVVIYGRLKTGAEVHQSGKATLRRVNDVPGATAEQRRWRIDHVALHG
jgi:membrane-bound inhibitor of C-type lysozyme